MNNNSVSIKWEEPPVGAATGPKVHGRRSKWDKVAETLRSNPDRWALVGENKAASYIAPLKHRGQFEIRYVTAGKGYKQSYADMYARFNGDSNE